MTTPSLLTPTEPTEAEMFVLLIDHEHGTDTSLHPTAEAAREKLHAYVTEWWDREINEHRDIDDRLPQPTDRDEAITTYFDGNQYEDWRIEPVTVPQPTTAWLLTIPTRHATVTSAHRTLDGAQQALAAYVADQWDAEVNYRWNEDNQPHRPLPADDEAAITAYFEIVEDEDYTIEPVPLGG